MKVARLLMFSCLVAVSMLSSGCAKLFLIFADQNTSTVDTVDFVVTNVDTGEVLFDDTLDTNDQVAKLLLKTVQLNPTTRRVTKRLNLNIDAFYNGSMTPLNIQTTLSPLQTRYVIVDNTDPMNPTIRVDNTNTSGVVIPAH